MAKKQLSLMVGLGASAGGVQALQTFFERMPDQNGMAFVVVVHLSEQHKSQMDSIIQAKTGMKVIQVQETIKVEPEHVYVIPPAKQLELEDGVITLAPLQRADHTNLAIDHFFRTLAKAYDGRAVGIVLSGTGSDGSLGLKTIKEYNGITLVQDPNEAEHRDMPNNALQTGLVDFILPVAEMPNKLIELKNTNRPLQLIVQEDKSTGTKEKEIEHLHEILRLVRGQTGNDFSHYKTPTLLRRVSRRMQIHGLKSFSDYIDLLQEKTEEIEPLLKSLLINVTEFFRDKEAFEFLEQEIIPELFAGKTADDPIRIWVAACASGEEAYSLAILLTEHLHKMSRQPGIQIFATDLSEEAVARARKGIFPKAIALDLSEARLKRFFIEEEDHYRIRNEIREMILFTTHNILADPPFLRLDMISCRNFLIYLNRSAQQKVLRLFHFALLPGKYLFLGNSESADSKGHLFSTVEKKHSIYARLASIVESEDPLTLPISSTWKTQIPIYRSTKQEVSFPVGELHHRLLEYYAAPSVVVNENQEIVHFSESATRYFQYSAGKPTNQLLSSVAPALRQDLRTLLFTVRQQQGTVEAKKLKVEINGQEETINLVAHAIDQIPSLRGFILILFQKSLPEQKKTVVETDSLAVKPAMQEMMRHQEEELVSTKDRLRITIEQYETLVEELKASNEELYAVNEEMRSTTEELETSKEELQSVNEEMKAVNQELKEKLDALGRSNSHLQNLIASTDIGTVFLDRHLQIQLFTPAIQDLFNILPSDIGRPLTHITNELDYPELTDDIKRVLNDLQVKEREIKSRDNLWYIVRLRPYRTVEDQIDGVVLTFLDITERKQAEEALTEERLRLALEDTNIGIWEYDLGEKRIKWSESLYKMYEVKPGKFQGTLENWSKLIHPEDKAIFKQKVKQSIETEEDLSLEVRRIKKNGATGWFLFKARVIRAKADKASLVRGAVLDITERKQNEEQLLNAKNELDADLKAMTLLQKLSSRLFVHDELKKLLEEVLEASMKMQNADAGTIKLFNNETGQMEFGAHIGINQDHFNLFKDDTEENLIWKQLMKAGKRVIIKGPADRERFQSFDQLVEQYGYQAFQAIPLLNRTGHPLGILSLYFRKPYSPPERELRLTDLYAAQAAEMIRFKLTEDALREADRRKSEFLAILSHELRNPLTPISTAMELLEQDQEKGQSKKLHGIITRQVKHIEKLVAELLDISRIERGKIELHKKSTILQDAVHRAIEINRSTIDENSHQLLVEMPNEPVYLESDPDRLIQIVQNLLNNASKYTEPGGRIELTVSTSGKEAVIQVKDNGIGIPPEQLNEVFEMFTQIDQKEKGLKGGLGIGLKLVKQLVDLHGGTVESKSEGLGRGSEFIVRLPLARQLAIRENKTKPSDNPPKRKKVELQRVLVVDDNEDIAFVTAEVIKRDGHEVTVVHSGEEAIRTALEMRPDTAVIDIGLPDVSGYSVATTLRKALPEIFLIAYSGWGQDSDRHRALEAGFDIHVTKPTDLRNLVELIARKGHT